MRHIRSKKANGALRSWVLGSVAGLALVAGGGIAAQAATAVHATPAKPGTSASAPKPVASTPGKSTSGDTDPVVAVPGDENGKPFPKPVPSTGAKQTTVVKPASGDTDPVVAVPGDENGKPFPGHAGR
ncbi:hypothetical protein ABZZ36_28710 [Actinacidiphila glaucinigra]|uniref:hypothetical protein n=1 Tax=Actinacidiphila glaucinigra TaxID=235986 RepID=UPI0033B7B94A